MKAHECNSYSLTLTSVQGISDICYAIGKLIEVRIKSLTIRIWIQGCNADITKMALIKIKKYIEEHRVDVKIVNIIHDEIICEVPDEYAEEWLKIQENLMWEAGKVVIKNGMLKSDGGIRKQWEKV